MSVYGCNSQRTKDTAPRGRATTILAQDGYEYSPTPAGTMTRASILRTVVTEWNDMSCGYANRINDSQCAGCANQGE